MRLLPGSATPEHERESRPEASQRRLRKRHKHIFASSFPKRLCPSEQLSRISNKLHKSIIHVQLLVAVPERIAWIVGCEIDFDRIERHHIDHIFLQSADRLFADTGDFKRMSMQMNGMLISAAIAQDKAIAF